MMRQTKDVSLAVPVENRESAEAAGLRYVSQHSKGITRRRRGKGFFYTDGSGKMIRNRETLERIGGLVLPPAWEEVWICTDPRGHLQAMGKDQRGRWQYRYHPLWREVRDSTKYERMIAFGRALPKIRRQVRRDMQRKGLPREKVIAAVVNLLETTLIRVGNKEYARTNNSFGLTTMRNRHVEVHGSAIHFDFRGKSGVEHAIDLHDKKLARIIKACQDLPGHELFQYVDSKGTRHSIASQDVNAYLHSVAGGQFTCKDFRTWAGTVLAAMALQEFEQFDSQTQAKKNVVAAIESVARKLGNTKAVCRKCYVHPAILNTYLNGNLRETLKHRVEEKMTKSIGSLRPEEAAVMGLLRETLARKPNGRSRAKAAA